MKSIEQLKNGSPTIQELKQGIQERRELIGQMVGQLYPSILESEIDKIYNMINAIVTRAADRSTM